MALLILRPRYCNGKREMIRARQPGNDNPEMLCSGCCSHLTSTSRHLEFLTRTLRRPFHRPDTGSKALTIDFENLRGAFPTYSIRPLHVCLGSCVPQIEAEIVQAQ